MIAFEDGDKVILRHISNINNYVNLVEERGEFIRHTTEVAIVDKNNSELYMHKLYLEVAQLKSKVIYAPTTLPKNAKFEV